MSPQFVDFNADGHLDIVAGTFDGSPHVALGTGKGWKQPEWILDKGGERIMLNEFWNFDTKKWDSTKRCDAPGTEGAGHATSAIAFDWDGDGDLDLLLGDHRSGHVHVRLNEGTSAKPSFAAKNAPVLAGGKPLDVPGTVATMRLFDWNHDGLLDLLCGGMGDAFGEGEGGGIYLFVNTGSKTATSFAAPVTLVPVSKKGGTEPTRPDSGLYMDIGDADGDGDLDLVVGGYSQWTPKVPLLNTEQKTRVRELRKEVAQLDKLSEAMMETVDNATKGLDEAAAQKKRTEMLTKQKDERVALAKKRTAVQNELDPLEPGAKRVSYVWFYENVTPTEQRPAGPSDRR